MTTYSVHLSDQTRTIDISAKASLKQVRAQLGVDFRKYQFVYFNPVNRRKTILNHQSDEAGAQLGAFVFPGNKMIMACVNPNNPDYFGNRTDFYRDRNMGIRVKRNTADGGALPPGDFEPLMLQEVAPANPDASDFFADNLVICQKGGLVQFEISSWGAAGFGYSIASRKDHIVDGLYTLYDPEEYGTESWITARRYQGKPDQPGNTIKIESLESQGYSEELKAEYSKVTVKTWRVTAWKGDGKTGSSSLQPPPPSLGLDDDGGSGLFDKAASGDTVVPNNAVQSAMATHGKPSSQKIKYVDSITSDAGSGHVVGAVTFFVAVFRDKAHANSVMNVLNSSDPLPFPQ